MYQHQQTLEHDVTPSVPKVAERVQFSNIIQTEPQSKEPQISTLPPPPDISTKEPQKTSKADEIVDLKQQLADALKQIELLSR